MSECALPDGVHALIKIMTHRPEREWCQRYIEETGMTDRSYRRHKEKAAQIVECHATQSRCPNVRAAAGRDLCVALPDNRTADLGIPSNSTTEMQPATQVASSSEKRERCGRSSKNIDWSHFAEKLTQSNLPLMDEPLRDAIERRLHTSYGRAGFAHDGLDAFDEEAYEAPTLAESRHLSCPCLRGSG